MAITRTADVDDDGTGTTGTVHNNAWKTALYDAIDGRWSEFSTTAVGNQDNFPYSEADVIRCNNATTLTLRGLLAPASPLKPGKPVFVVSVGAGPVVINDQDVNSTAANRVITGASAALTLTAGTGVAYLEYDSVTARYRVVFSSATAAFTGTPTAPTAAPGTNTTQLATTAFVEGEIASKAPLASPALTGTPTAPTAAVGTNTTQLATTAFVAAAGVVGTWTPIDSSGAGLALSVTSAVYFKFGSLVYVSFDLSYPVTASGANARIGGLPFTTASAQSGLDQGYSTIGSLVQWLVRGANTVVDPMDWSGANKTNAQMSGKNFVVSGVYRT